VSPKKTVSRGGTRVRRVQLNDGRRIRVDILATRLRMLRWLLAHGEPAMPTAISRGARLTPRERLRVDFYLSFPWFTRVPTGYWPTQEGVEALKEHGSR